MIVCVGKREIGGMGGGTMEVLIEIPLFVVLISLNCFYFILLTISIQIFFFSFI